MAPMTSPFDRKPTLHLDEAASRHRRVAAVVDCILKCLGGLFDERPAARLGAAKSTEAAIAVWFMRSSRMSQPLS
jgi:hypothetical protein